MNIDKAKILRSLNKAQRAAVEIVDGPVLVLAGAGTGKTSVITNRVAYLIAHGIRPEEILTVTFTNKAAREMRERAARIVGGELASKVTLSTFHSLCLKILKREIRHLGYSARFSIYGRSEQLGVVKQAMNAVVSSTGNRKPEDVLARIGAFKNRGLLPDGFEPESDNDAYAQAVYRQYQRMMKAYNAIDFDDMLLLTIRLFDENEKILARYREKYKYLMIDEYQDTNGIQYRLTRQLAGERANVFVVGDDDQSIYAFRGANAGHILRFDRDFAGTRVIMLEENYRSTNNILGAANCVIKANSERYAKTLFSGLGQGDPIELHAISDAAEEADYVAGRIISLHVSGHPYRDIAVLIRAAAQSRVFEERFRARMIPYRLIGGQSFYERKEVLDVLAYLHVVANPADELSIRRVINYPARGVGTKTVETVAAAADEQKKRFHEILADDIWRSANLTPQANSGIRAFLDLVETAGKRLADSSLLSVVRELIEATGIRDEIVKNSRDDVEYRLRLDNVEEILNAVDAYEKNTAKPTLADFIQQQMLLTDRDDEKNTDDENSSSVSLITIHSAKGLEWPCVFIPGIEDGLLPHKKSIADEIDPHAAICEERRLFYVAITRAKRLLIMTYCSERSSFGRTVGREISRFVGDIDEKFLLRGNGRGRELDATESRQRMSSLISGLKNKIEQGG